MLVDDILLALGQADRRRVLEFIRDQKPGGDSHGSAPVSELNEAARAQRPENFGGRFSR